MTWVAIEIFSVTTELFWALCRDHGLCSDQAWSRLGGLVSQHSKCVETGQCNGCALAQAAMLSTGPCALATELTRAGVIGDFRDKEALLR